MSSTIDNLGDNGVRYWEKQAYDTSPNADGFGAARDLGYVRLNYSRLNTVAQLSDKDTADYFKINVISTGKIRISLQDSTPDENILDLDGYYEKLGLETPSDKAEAELIAQAKAEEEAIANEDKILDLSKYEEYLAKFDTEPEEEPTSTDTSIEETLAKYEDTINQLKAKSLKFKLYSYDGFNEKILADSDAEKGSEERNNYESLLRGEYEAPDKGVYYIKVEKSEDFEDDNLYYTMQIQMGSEYSNQYTMTEIKSKDEDKSDYELSMTTSAQLDTSTAITVTSYNSQQLAMEGAASLLSSGYTSMQTILNFQTTTESTGFFDIFG